MLDKQNPYTPYVKLLSNDIEQRRREIEESRRRIQKAKLNEFRRAWTKTLEVDEMFLQDNLKDLNEFLLKEEDWYKNNKRKNLNN